MSIHLISLGAGVQSSTMALMAACGEIEPMPTAAIFADTQAEPASVYRWLDWLEKQLPFPVHRVTAGSLTERSLSVRTNQKTGVPYYSNMIPAFIKNPDGSKGIVHRHCTSDYKIVPINRAVRKLAAIKRGEKSVQVVQWIGISMDEMKRMKPSREPWSEHRWPLIEKRISRNGCLEWMDSKGFPRAPRSACKYCPFHGNQEWRRMKNDEPEEFADAVQYEKDLQELHANMTCNGSIHGIPFLHSSLVPLAEVDLRTDLEKGQLSLWDEECEGMCGV